MWHFVSKNIMNVLDFQLPSSVTGREIIDFDVCETSCWKNHMTVVSLSNRRLATSLFMEPFEFNRKAQEPAFGVALLVLVHVKPKMHDQPPIHQ